MLKKTIAIMLAAVMLLQPVAASAVSWGEVVSSLQSSGSYSGEGTTATKDDEGKVTVTGGTVSDVHIDDEGGEYTFVDVTIDGENFILMMNTQTAKVVLDEGTALDTAHVYVQANDAAGSSTLVVNEGASIQAASVGVYAYNGGEAVLENHGVIDDISGVDEDGNTYSGQVSAYADSGASVTIVNGAEGSIDAGSLSMDSWDEGSKASFTNEGEISSTWTSFSAADGGEMTAENKGAIDADRGVNVYTNSDSGEKSTASFTNSGEITGSGWTTSDGDYIESYVDAYAYGSGAETTLVNEGVVDGAISGGAENGKVDVIHSGEVNSLNANAGWNSSGGEVNVTITEEGVAGDTWFNASGDSVVNVTNYGETGNLNGWADGNGELNLINEGVVADYMEVYAQNDGQATMVNNGAVEGDIWVSAWENASASLTNNGSAGYMGAGAYDNATANVINNGTAGGAWVGAYDGSEMNATNNGAVEDYLNMGTDGNSSIAFESGENASAGSSTIFIDVPEGAEVSSEKIEQIIANISISAGTEIAIFSGDEVTAVYMVEEDGSVVLLEEAVKTPEHDGPDYDMIRHQMEEKRKQQAIGGVYGSPYWVKQLYLGYHSLNLRLYEDGEQLLFKQSLSWKDGGPEKRLTLRAEIEDPQALTMRLDGEVIEILERTEITAITLVDYNNQPYMEYSVADLKGAREMYGLERGDLLCVGSADAEVMKIGADGQMVPVEQETEVATDSEAATE